MQLAVQLLLITLVVELIGWIGNEAIAGFIFTLTSPLRAEPASIKGGPSPGVLKKEILALRAELKATSAQDEFAKWAKIRRNLDKKVAQLEETKSHSTAARAAFTSSFKKLLWVATTALPFVFSSYHRKAAVFYLPPQWFGPLQWFLSLPSAPAGAVACGIWTMAVKRSLGAVKDVVGGLVERDAVVPAPVPVGVKVPAGGAGGKVREKDEL